MERVIPPCEFRLRSPSLVAAVVASSSPRHYGYPLRNSVRRRRQAFERVLSDSNIDVHFRDLLERERISCGGIVLKKNEAQRLVKYRSTSSVSSYDSGIGGSRFSLHHSDSRPPLLRSLSSDGLGKSSWTPSPSGLPDLISSPPPLPPKTRRPPLPPRKRDCENLLYAHKCINSPLQWEAESDVCSSGLSSDSSLPEYLVDGDEEEERSKDVVCGVIQDAKPMQNSLHNFLTNMGHTFNTDLVIQNIYKDSSGFLNVYASAANDSDGCVSYPLPQMSQVPRPASLSPEGGCKNNSNLPSKLSCSGNGVNETVLSHKYRTELQIFFRTGTISRLEEQRDLVLTDTVVRLQAMCRGVLARRRMQNRKVQETAIRCIQKNVRKFMAVRDWPWWRLLVRVTPLLNVHRTEEELRSTKEELESIKTRLEKSEKERTDLKHENERLEARLTEVSADLSEEHNTAQLAGERIEAEQAERMKLEKEVSQLQIDVKRMTNTNDKLEMEKLSLRNEVLQHSELNGDIHDSDESSDSSLYKRKYEWCLREMEVLKKHLKQQQEDDLDQLLILKKQLEKKISDAYEETDEQRQVVAQLKKKSQRLTAEMNDMKILLEEQTSRNNLLEKKQRKFDQDIQSVQEEQRNERLAKEKIQREKDQILSEKYSYEQEVSTLKLELELKEEKVATLTREIEDLNFTGKVEEEVALLKKAKHDLELRVKDQEEELDDLAGQVQMLEGAKIRLQMSIEQMRKENRKEIQQKDEEIEEVRVTAQKKIKGLESQLEAEHEERTQLVRDKHDLERRLADAQDRSFATVDEDAFHRVKKELKKTKALLKDTQTMLEKSQSEGSNKLVLRQLKTQLEDAEFAKTAALKARQSAESDFAEAQSQLEEALRAKKDYEEKCARLAKEKTDMQTQFEESEEEMAEVMKKYKATVSQLSIDQINIAEQSQLIADLEHDKQVLQERLTELSSKVEVLEGETANIHTQRRLQMKIKELESKLELELTTRQRLESQIARLKDQIDRISSECDSARSKENQAVDHGKKLTRQLREAKDDVSNFQQKHTDALGRKQEIEKQYELAESEILTLKSDLKLAFKRIEDLQQALQGDLSDSDSEMSDSESESETSLTSFLTASMKHDRSSSNSTLRTAPSESPQESKAEIIGSPGSEIMSVINEDIEDDYKESFA